MQHFNWRHASSALVLVFLPAAVWAHTGVGPTSGLLHGFLHPLGGLDHVLAMVAVGLFAWLLQGRALWLVPLAFVGAMAAAGVLGALGPELPFIETGIALSIVVLGSLVAIGRGLPLIAAMAVVMLFAVFHGHAHGAEMPAMTSAAGYGLGFVLASALLHGIGLAIGSGLARVGRRTAWARACGVAIALAGIAILFAGFAV